MAGFYSTKVILLLSQAQHMNSFLPQRLLFLFLPVDGILFGRLGFIFHPFLFFFLYFPYPSRPSPFLFLPLKRSLGTFPVVQWLRLSSNAGGASSMHDQGTEAPGVLVTRSCLTLCHPVDYNPPGSSVSGNLQARILEWVAIPFSSGSPWPRDQTQVSCVAGRFFTTELPGNLTAPKVQPKIK